MSNITFEYHIPIEEFKKIADSELLEKLDELKNKLDIAVKGLNFIASQTYGKDMYDCAKWTLKQLEEVK